MSDTPARATFPWRAVLDVSTGYLSRETHRVLEGWTAESAPILFGHTHYGWFVWCPEEWDAYEDDVPADLREVLTWARAQGAEYVLFDADGCDDHQGIPWREGEPPQGIGGATQEDSQAKPLAFDPAKVEITRHRMSTTQGEVSVAYDGQHIERYGDDIRLGPDGYHGRPDEFWIDVARSVTHLRGMTGSS